MKLVTLLTTLPVVDIIAAFNSAYPDDKLTEEFYRERFLPVIRSKIIENKPGSSIIIDYIEERHDDPVDDHEHHNVSLMDDTGEVWGMSFVPWAELLGQEVVSRSHLDMTPAEAAAHVFWEMTWHGMEEAMEDRRDEVMDRLDEVMDAFDAAENSEEVGAPLSSMRPLSEFLDEMEAKLSDEERVVHEKFRKNFKSRRVYVNGKLTRG